MQPHFPYQNPQGVCTRRYFTLLRKHHDIYAMLGDLCTTFLIAAIHVNLLSHGGDADGAHQAHADASVSACHADAHDCEVR